MKFDMFGCLQVVDREIHRYSLFQLLVFLISPLLLSLWMKFKVPLPALVPSLLLCVLSRTNNATAIVNHIPWNMYNVSLCLHQCNLSVVLIQRCIVLKHILNHASMGARHVTFVDRELSILRLCAHAVKE